MRRQGGFWKNVLAGLLMGIGCVLPGVSGGVMAVSFGLYRPMLDAVLAVDTAPIAQDAMARGLRGPQIGEQIHVARVNAVRAAQAGLDMAGLQLSAT